MKVVLRLLMLLVITIYLVMAFTRFNKQDPKLVCKDVEISFKEQHKQSFINDSVTRVYLQKKNLYPLNKLVDSVNTNTLEFVLSQHPYIKKAICYKSPTGCINIEIDQYHPVLRVIADNGENYYLDEEGNAMELLPGLREDLMVASGHITKAYAKEHLTDLGKLFLSNTYWNNQITQLYIDKDSCLEIIPRVGDQQIYAGKPEQMELKLRHLKAFYDQVIPKVGWNKYSRINLEYNNQIICQKR